MMGTSETWRKSSRSNAGSACVELSVRGVRDSKNRDGSVLAFEPATVRAFLASVKHC
jgi:hypothetical protein